MRKHIFLGSGRSVRRSDIQKAMHSLDYAGKSRRVADSSSRKPVAPMGSSMKKINPLKFRF